MASLKSPLSKLARPDLSIPISCAIPTLCAAILKGAVGTLRERTKALFISHASPEDNAFTIWLGAKLAAAGYEVWADVLRLKGGDDWQRKLEDALRNRACKVLLVANQKSVDKQGVRNEIQIASDVAKKIGDSRLIIPLRLGPFEAPFLIAHAQYIDFSHGWSPGLHELMAALQEGDGCCLNPACRRGFGRLLGIALAGGPPRRGCETQGDRRVRHGAGAARQWLLSHPRIIV